MVTVGLYSVLVANFCIRTLNVRCREVKILAAGNELARTFAHPFIVFFTQKKFKLTRNNSKKVINAKLRRRHLLNPSNRGVAAIPVNEHAHVV